METVQIEELELNPSKYLGLARTGETLSILEKDREILKIVPVPQPQQALRPIGLSKGQFTVPDDFDAPLSDVQLEDWYGPS